MFIFCTVCSDKFEFTETEQEFYKEKGWGDLKPKRCPPCRKKVKTEAKQKAIQKKSKHKPDAPKTPKGGAKTAKGDESDQVKVLSVNAAGDMELACIVCSDSFLFTKLDQDFYVKKGWGDLKPKRCKRCKKREKETGGAKGKRESKGKGKGGSGAKGGSSGKGKPDKKKAKGDEHEEECGPLAPDMVKVVIGKGGETIKSILKRTKAMVRVDTETRMVLVKGPTQKAVENALAAVEEVQAEERKQREAAAERASERLEREKHQQRKERREAEAKAAAEGTALPVAPKGNKKRSKEATQEEEASPHKKRKTEEVQERRKSQASLFREGKKKKSKKSPDALKAKPAPSQKGDRKRKLGVVPKGAKTSVAKITAGLD